jgi:hypothetical protein
MLVELLSLLREIMEERACSNTQYSGWGTYGDEAIRDCLDAGVPIRLVQRIERLAYYGYWF